MKPSLPTPFSINNTLLETLSPFYDVVLDSLGNLIFRNHLLIKVDDKDVERFDIRAYIRSLAGSKKITLHYSNGKTRTLEDKTVVEKLTNLFGKSEFRQSHCNPGLFLIVTEGIEQLLTDYGYYAEQTLINVSSGDGPPPPSKPIVGGDYVAFSQIDSLIEEGLAFPLNETILGRYKANYTNRHLADKPLVVVMDTGLDYHHFSGVTSLPIWFNPNGSTCNTISPDFIGWDFVHDHHSPYDDHPGKHGTQIALMINEQAQGNVQIMPLKTFDRNGVGSFFNILCGFEYIINRSRKMHVPVIINASWGFYLPDENAPLIPIFDNYVQKLAESNILLVTAAGNRSDFGNPTDEPDISVFKRYPACLSTHPNVKTVTTVGVLSLSVSPTGSEIVFPIENYSEQFVDVGVQTRSPKGLFRNLLNTTDGWTGIAGSSFATACVAGEVGRIVGSGQSPIVAIANWLPTLSTLSGPALLKENRVFTPDSVVI